MVYFPSGDGTRLAQVRMLSGGFPFYGQFETEPASAVEEFRKGAGALVEENLLIQFDAKVGDTVKVGQLSVPIVGSLRKVPGESAAALALVSPRVYLPMKDLAATQLEGRGSLARYTVFFKFPTTTNVDEMVTSIEPQLDKFALWNETVSKRKQNLGRAMENLYHFLNLAGLIAMLLGGIGVAGAIHTHVKQKLPIAATLRCIGAPVSQTFAVYLAQGIGLGFVGAVAGVLLGAAVQKAIPHAVASFIPFEFQFRTAWLAIARAGLVGFCICLLFALLPLLAIRRVSPLAALRVALDPSPGARDPLRWLVVVILFVAFFAFGLGKEHNWRMALSFTGALVVVFLSLAGTALLLMRIMRKYVQPGLPFVFRQGLAGLYRPNNRTHLLIFSLGVGTFLLTSIAFIEQMLAGDLLIATGPHQANAILFDIQETQHAGVSNLVASLHLPVLDEFAAGQHAHCSRQRPGRG